MARPISQGSIWLPQHLLKASCGLGFDIGGTVAKIVYRSKEEYRGGEPIVDKVKGERGCLHLAMYPRADVSDIIKFMTDNVDLTPVATGQIVVHATGIGAYQYKGEIEKALGFKVNMLMETDCFVNAFKALINVLPDDELLHPPTEAALEQVRKMNELIEDFKRKMETNPMEMQFLPDEAALARLEEAQAAENPHLPALLAMCGSGIGLMLVKEDGSSQFADMVQFGGRTFLGMANLLVGVKDFSKLMEMAEASDGKTTDTCGADLQTFGEVDEDSLYQINDEDMPAFLMGKGYTSDRSEIKDGDIVKSLLEVACSTLGNSAHVNAVLHKVRHVYFCGNFVNSITSRSNVEKVGLMRNITVPSGPEFKFLQHGGLYGAIGCFLHDKKPPNKK